MMINDKEEFGLYFLSFINLKKPTPIYQIFLNTIRKTTSYLLFAFI